MGVIEAIVFSTLASTLVNTAVQLGQGKPQVPEPESPAEAERGGALALARESEKRRRQQQRGGRASTIMSGSPLGAPAQATTAKKYLTGA